MANTNKKEALVLISRNIMTLDDLCQDVKKNRKHQWVRVSIAEDAIDLAAKPNKK